MNIYEFCKQIISSGVLKHLQGEQVVIIGEGKRGYLVGENYIKEETYWGISAAENGANPTIAELAGNIKGSRFLATLDKLSGKYNAVIVLSGLEKEKAPCEILGELYKMLVPQGMLFCVVRTPNRLFVRDNLYEYEDLWRFTATDFEQIFGASPAILIEEPEGGYMAVGMRKIIRKPLRNYALFSCRTESRLLPQELENKGYFAKYKELDNIGIKFGTDKNRYHHNYLPQYEFFLEKFRNREFNLLELGIFRGGSAKMWEEYFTRAIIHCVDIDERCSQYSTDRIITHITDLSVKKNVEKLREISPTIIIDDASHMWSHQLLALFTLYSCLPTGGVYILEDLETSLNIGLYPDMECGSRHNVFTVISRIAKVVGSKEPESDTDELSPFITDIGLHTETITLLKGSCIFIKR